MRNRTVTDSPVPTRPSSEADAGTRTPHGVFGAEWGAGNARVAICRNENGAARRVTATAISAAVFYAAALPVALGWAAGKRSGQSGRPLVGTVVFAGGLGLVIVALKSRCIREAGGASPFHGRLGSIAGSPNPAITLLSKRVTARIFPPARVTMIRPVPCRVPASECR